MVWKFGECVPAKEVSSLHDYVSKLLGPSPTALVVVVVVVSFSEGYTRAFGDGPRPFEPWSSDDDDT
ncbi:hypothetical protein TNCV_3140741 [Trichonephila clavipes]|nr:hypothetical protein TNCV_3140741 [Trichonephila clavipes]